jgi:predicted DNA binding protein
VTPTEDARLLVFSVRGERLDGFDRSITEDHTVSNPLVIAGSSGRRIYRVELTDNAVSVRPRLVEAGGHATTVEIREGNWDISAQFAARETLSNFRRYCAGEAISFRLHKLCLVDEEGNREGGRLTPNQRETLQSAYRAGYFEVPRGITQTELAELLDVSPSAVSQRVRRAIDRLVAQQTWSGDE